MTMEKAYQKNPARARWAGEGVMTDEEFSIVFPAPGQDIEFIEDAIDRVGDDELGAVMRNVWKRRVKKIDIIGIHGTVFYELSWKKKYYPNKRDDDIKR